MFETLTKRPLLNGVAVSEPPKIDAPRVHLSWSEHCLECSAPACYTSCDLYDPTPAGKCRRFDGGVQPNKALATDLGPAADIIFKHWGKLEAQGNAALFPARKLTGVERLWERAIRVINPIGKLFYTATRQMRWAVAAEFLEKKTNKWLEKQTGGQLPDTIVLDTINPAKEPITLRLNVYVDIKRLARVIPADQLPPPFVTMITLPPGQSRQDVDVSGAQTIFGSGLAFNLAISPQAEGETHVVFRVLELVAKDRQQAVAAAAEVKRPAAKCVIFDLDNTLWDGILLEGNVQVRAGVQKLFETLDERGILISIASKNAPEDALARLEAAGLKDYVLYPQIGWGQKSEGIKRIGKAIDIGIDTLMFIDDNPFERDEVAKVLPTVEVLPDTAIATLADHPRLQGAVTAESKARRQMYRQAMEREAEAASFGDDYIEFLRSCEIVCEIRRERPEDFERIAELVQRTNQLNFSGKKYDREAITNILSNDDQQRHLVSVSDKFGSYGIVGFCLSSRHGDTVRVDDFMLSCRVQGKFIEQALFWFLTQSSEPQATRLEVNFHPTPRNGAAQMVLERLGIRNTDDSPMMMRELKRDDLTVDFIDIV